MKRMSRFLLLSSLILVLCSGCDNSNPPDDEAKDSSTILYRDNTSTVLVPTADGTEVYSNELVSIDGSHKDQGYVMVHYNGSNPKVKLSLTGPDEVEYYYLLGSRDREYEAFPLTAGDGKYDLLVYENVSGDNYSIAFATDFEVSLENEYLPYLYSNQYVYFTEDSKSISKGQELAAECTSDIEVIQNIYNYVIENIEYDYDKASSVEYGYLPDVDDTLSTGKGICFDYAVLMASMLRSERIPTRLEVGYVENLYHAWISTYIEDKGWIDNIIEFDGESWKILDPTRASTNHKSSDVENNGSEYLIKFTY